MNRNSENLLSADLTPETVTSLYHELESMPLTNTNEVTEMLARWTNVEDALGEAHAKLYIQFSQNTGNEEFRKLLDSFIEEVEPVAEEACDRLNKLLMHNLVAKQYLETTENTFFQQVKRRIEIFRLENVAVSASTEILSQDHAELTGGLTILYQDNTLTMEQAYALLEGNNRDNREEIYRLMLEKRIGIRTELHGLMDKLLKMRYQIAINAGFKNYRDFRHFELERFDYSVADVVSLHGTIQQHFVPLADKVMIRRKQLLGYSELMPWDLATDPEMRAPLQPFHTAQELIEGGRETLYAIDLRLGQLLDEMEVNGHLDLEARDKKASGAFSFNLPQSHASFLFMNAAGTHDDVVTLMHEMGHALHDKLCGHHPFYFHKNFPMEVAELASMSLELISSSFWTPFYPEKTDLNRARVNLLEGVVLGLPWIAAVDEFQHWLYTHPEHSQSERDTAWTKIYKKYACLEVCYAGVEEAFVFGWQHQSHIYEEPFYYIEYAIAQLGALELWMHYQEQGDEALQQFFSALALGGQFSVTEIYRQAGLNFTFSENRIVKLAQFFGEQLDVAYAVKG